MKISDALFGAAVVLGIIGFVFFIRVNFIYKGDSLVGLYISGAALLLLAGILINLFLRKL